MKTPTTCSSIAAGQAVPSHEELGRRRPLKAREIPAWKRFAVSLNHLGVSPNQVSIAGLCAGIGAGVALAMTRQAEGAMIERILWATAILGMLLRGAGNILDGVLAVECKQATPAGHLYNEVPDRISDIAMLLGAGYAAGGHAALGWLAAIVALFVAYLRVQVDVAGARQSFIGPMAKPARVAVIVLAALIEVVAGDACRFSLGNSHGWGPVSVALALIIAGGAITAVRRLRKAARELNRNYEANHS